MKLGQFLEWLEGHARKKYPDEPADVSTFCVDIEETLAEYFDIDREELSREKDKMVEEMTALAESSYRPRKPVPV